MNKEDILRSKFSSPGEFHRFQQNSAYRKVLEAMEEYKNKKKRVSDSVYSVKCSGHDEQARGMAEVKKKQEYNHLFGNE